jgi:DNA-J related protein/DnaJ domain
MAQNPLIIPILEILKSTQENISEYDLICKLEQQGIEYQVKNESYDMTMFKKHFMTMNALYYLQMELIAEGYYLLITPLKIKIEIINQATESTSLANDAEIKIRDYYLDWQHFDKTTQQDVETLLSGFWIKYFALEKREHALAVLYLDAEVSWDEIQQTYRRLARQHHPDKGGKHSVFIEIREAYEILRHYYEK